MQLLLITERMWAEKKAGDGVLADPDHTPSGRVLVSIQIHVPQERLGNNIAEVMGRFPRNSAAAFPFCFFTSVHSFSLYHYSTKPSQGFVFSALKRKRQALWRGHEVVNERMTSVLK